MLFLVETKGEAAHLAPFAEDLPHPFLDFLRRASSVATLLGPRYFLHLTRYVPLVSHREDFALPRAGRYELFVCEVILFSSLRTWPNPPRTWALHGRRFT
jgi:hypothetical protein